MRRKSWRRNMTERADGLGPSALHISHQIAVLVHVDAHVQHHLAGGQTLGGHRSSLACRRHQQICPTALGGQVGGAGVADGDGGMTAQQQHGHRFANDQTAAHHHRPLALQLVAVVVQDFQAGLGGAGRVSRAAAGKYRRQGPGSDAVHVLGGGEGGADCGLIHVLGQGAKQETAVDGVVPVDLLDDLHQVGLTGGGGE